MPYDREEILKSIEIGRYVWIGMNVNVLPGVKIGDGAIIGMGVTVSKDVAPGEVLVGAPNRVVRVRDKEHSSRLFSAGSFLTHKRVK